MKKKLILYSHRIREQLWFRPFLFCLFSVMAALIANKADGFGIEDMVPDVEQESIGSLLDIISASMLVISIFAVTSMISAFSSASNTATPRSFKVVVTDDVSQNALSVFIGAFIFSIVATIALDNGYYGKSGRFILFLITLTLFAAVILTFLRWVDRISRLGRLEHTIKQIERVVTRSLSKYLEHPTRKGRAIEGEWENALAVYANETGYVQHLHLELLQELAEDEDLNIRLNCLPGKFIHENHPIAYYRSKGEADVVRIGTEVCEAITMGETRHFDEDPRFGLIALTEIASRALSPGINDPGTAIQIIGSHERLFFQWNSKDEQADRPEVEYDRIEVPELSVEDFFEDAFRPIARDGAGNIEVMLRLQKTLSSIYTIADPQLQKYALQHSEQAYRRAEASIDAEKDLQTLRDACLFLHRGQVSA
ncbi:MAG: DUF2254 domain-containing protein [Flavobacteriales bacterium]|nr:DUF2254 domain-containing protein [Flavobacteriales bacterium]